MNHYDSMYIYCLQQLMVFPKYTSITRMNIELIALASDLILKRHSSGDNMSLYSNFDLNTLSACKITWRPASCIDVFVYISDDPAGIVIGIPTNDANDPVEYLSTVSTVEMSNCGDFILLCHLTSDVISDAKNELVLLVYDVLYPDFENKPSNDLLASRYEFLQSKATEISALKIGNASTKVQWIGDPISHEMLKNLELPHDTTGLVVLDDAFQYCVWAY